MSKELIMRYKHDCEKCKPLGQFLEDDLYYCDQGGRPTVIARYGDDGPDYVSGMRLTNMDYRLHVALEMAKAVGLIKEDR